MDYNKDSQNSIFNMAFAYLERLNKLLYSCQEAALKQDINSWINNLRAVNREACIKMQETEQKDVQAKFTVILSKCKTKNEMIQKKQEILFLLDSLEQDIRKIMQKRGMLLPSKDDPRYSVTKR